MDRDFLGKKEIRLHTEVVNELRVDLTSNWKRKKQNKTPQNQSFQTLAGEPQETKENLSLSKKATILTENWSESVVRSTVQEVAQWKERSIPGYGQGSRFVKGL